MEAYVALLRGINVSGHRIIKMAELKNALSRPELLDLQTYLQSGNLVFISGSSSCKALEHIITHTVKKDFGFDIKVKVVKKKQFQKAFVDNPFLDQQHIDTKQLYYIHLMDTPDPDVFEALANDNKYPEQMCLIGNVIYVNYLNGYGRSKLHGNIIEKKLKVSATARNYNTMKKLSEMLEALQLD